MLIESLQNPRIKEIVRLREKRDRDKAQKFLIEGFREISRALQGKWELEALYFCPDCFLGENENALIQRAYDKGAAIFEVARPVFEKISYRDRPDGLLAVAPQRHLALRDLQLTSASLFVVAEAIEKPGNLGSILRSSDAAGATGLIVCDRCTDIFNPNVVRSSVGTLFTVPVVEAAQDEVIAWLKQSKIKIVATTPHTKHLYTDVDLKQSVAIAVGTEQLGLSRVWLDEADLSVRIPMLGVADSLNVAAATTLLLYEAVRQRCTSSLKITT